MRKKVINILFNDFTNDNRVYKESISLIKGGFDVELVATRFDKKNSIIQDLDGIKIRRVSVGKLAILPLNLLFFWFNIIKLYKKEEIFHCNDLYALPPVYFIKKFINRDIKIIYDCHEYETEARIYIGRPLLKWLAKVIERLMIDSVDKVITVSESIAQDYIQLYEIEKPLLVMNCPKFSKLHKSNIFREKFNIDKEKTIFLFQGEYLEGRGVEKLIEIFKILEIENKNLVLILLVYGEGLEKLRQSVNDSKNIYWHNKVSVLEYMSYVESADWGILLLENLCKSYDFSLPNKLFDYIGGGLPVVVSNLKELSSFVKKNKVGYVVDESSLENVIKVLSKIDKDTKLKFEKELLSTAKKYCWEEQEKVLLEVYNSL